MELAILIISIIAIVYGAIITYKIVTSKPLTKVTNRFGDVAVIHAENMVVSAKLAGKMNKLDAVQELRDDGRTKDSISSDINDFDEMFLDIKAN